MRRLRSRILNTLIPTFKSQSNGWWKNFEDMFIRFDVIHERDRRTDRRTLQDRAYASHRAVNMPMLALDIHLDDGPQ